MTDTERLIANISNSLKMWYEYKHRVSMNSESYQGLLTVVSANVSTATPSQSEMDKISAAAETYLDAIKPEKLG